MPTIVKGSEHFNIALDTGANIKTATEALFSGSQFLAVIKDRSNANNWQWIDSVRGLSNVLQSNTTGAETTYSAPSGNSVGYAWKAGTSSSTNTSGSITSTVSVNASAGFSVVTYTTPATNTFTVGHGLGVAPSLIFVKGRNQAYNWDVYHASLGATGRLILNTTSAFVTTSGPWANTAPTSTVFSSSGNGVYYNTGDTLVAYCFAPIAGYSAFGSYTGNGSTDGPMVYLGFRPKYFMWKRTDAATDWLILDTARAPYNSAGNFLFADLSNAEYSSNPSYQFDFLSNGIKVRSAAASDNASGGTYIYMAFAENPFKNALAR